MMFSNLDMSAQLDKLADTNAILCVGLKEHADEKKMQVRMIAWADDATASELRYFARVLAALGMGLRITGPADLMGEADKLLKTAEVVSDMANRKAGQA